MPTDSKTAEIVADLRILSKSPVGPMSEVEKALDTAADLLEGNAREIERLEKERDANGLEAHELRTERDTLRQQATKWATFYEAAEARASALEAERDKLREGLAVARAALEKSLEVFRNGLANRAFNGALYSHALTASHLINNAFILLTPAASGAEQGGEDHQLRPVEPAVDRGPQVTSALPGACAEKVAGARIDALEEAAKAMETTRDFGDTNVANAVRVVAARAIRKLKETGNG